MRIYFPQNEFIFEPKNSGCLFTARGTFRIGRLAKAFAKDKIESGISSVKIHMKEEGENLKQILENS